MNYRWSAALGLAGSIGLLPLSAWAQTAQAAPVSPSPGLAYAIDQTRYFATPEIESAQLKQSIDEAAAFPAAAPDDPARPRPHGLLPPALLRRVVRAAEHRVARAPRALLDRGEGDQA